MTQRSVDVTSAGMMTRRADADDSGDLNLYNLVRATAGGGQFYLSSATPTINTTAQVWESWDSADPPLRKGLLSDPASKVLTATATSITGANSGGSSGALAKADHNHAMAPERCQLTKSSLTLGTGAWTAITWDTEVYDSDGMHTGSSANIVAPSDGIYEITAYANIAASTAGTQRHIRIATSGGTEIWSQSMPPNSMNARLSVTGHVALTATDYVTVACYQDIGGNLTMSNARVAALKVAEL